MRIRQYCLTHDSLWLDSMGEGPVCETKAAELERDGVVPSSGKCDFIEIEIMQTGRKRLHEDPERKALLEAHPSPENDRAQDRYDRRQRRGD